jgi:hypothetical protein
MSMSKKVTQVVIALTVVATTATSASAEWKWNHFWHGLHVGFHRNNAWPDPFNEVDAAQVIAPFEIMKANGWRMHNTIGHELFRGGDGALLASGHRRVRWIATQSPESRRTVYVLRGETQAETAARVASVQSTLDKIAMEGPLPEVLVTDVEPPAASGEWATKINREWIEHLTAPRLPSQSSSGEQGVGAPTGGK